MTRPASERPVYELVLRPEASCGNPVLALRAALKRLLRDHALRCLSVRQVQPAGPEPAREADR